MSRKNVHVGLSEAELDIAAIIKLVKSPAAGAIVTFTGTTRDTFDGKVVLHLDYEAHDALATKSLETICTQAVVKWELLGAACFHRLGRVPVGEESILIAVSSAHRKAAWEAGEWILEEAKRKTEVWKLETFKEPGGDVSSVWKANHDAQTNKEQTTT